MTAGCSPLVYKKVEVGTVRAEIFQRREKHRRHTEFEMETGSDVKSLVFMKLADRRVGVFPVRCHGNTSPHLFIEKCQRLIF